MSFDTETVDQCSLNHHIPAPSTLPTIPYRKPNEISKTIPPSAQTKLPAAAIQVSWPAACRCHIVRCTATWLSSSQLPSHGRMEVDSYKVSSKPFVITVSRAAVSLGAARLLLPWPMGGSLGLPVRGIGGAGRVNVEHGRRTLVARKRSRS